MTRSDAEAKDVMLEAIEKFKMMLGNHLFYIEYCRHDRLQDLEDGDHHQHDEDLTSEDIAINLMGRYLLQQKEKEQKKDNKIDCCVCKEPVKYN